MGIELMASKTGRRRFLGGLLAAGLIPAPTWADAGSPAFLSAAAQPDGSFVLCGIGANLDVRFELPLPARGHAAAAHPIRPEAVAFARRPGTFALVIDCATGVQKAVLTCPTGRHFYGHGAFSSDGRLLFTTENDYEAGRGRIGVWDTQNGYNRIDEWDSGGIGPHDIKRLPDTDIFVVANGGIDTHPDTGRSKLNIPTMAPNLAYVKDGMLIETATLPANLHKNSIRHLAVSNQGHVAFGMQWQGDGAVDALVGIHQIGQPMRLMTASPNDVRDMKGYVGSIALSSDGQTIAVTSPRGGLLQRFDATTGALSHSTIIPDVSGVSILGQSTTVSSGTGEMRQIETAGQPILSQTNVRWDNHLIPISVG
jgi:hypothetical protein